MAFGFRKSVGLGSGVRMTFSKSGISTSVGGKGYRVTAGPRGTYISLGAGGIYYRQRIGGHLAPTSAPSPRPTYTPAGATPITTADASQLVELSSAATLQQLNAVSTESAYAIPVLIGGIVLAIILSAIYPVLSFIAVCLTLYFCYVTQKRDAQRRTFHLEYNLETDAQQRWNILNQSLAALAKAQKLWQITAENHNYDYKYNGGAEAVLRRASASLSQNSPKKVASNVTPYCMILENQQFFFYPDRVYVLQDNRYGAVEYSSLSLINRQTTAVENSGVPSDSQVIDETWRYVNKDGGPDRRFNDNYKIPVVEYGELKLTSTTGLNIFLNVSSVDAANQFEQLFKSFQSFSPSCSMPHEAKSDTHGPNPQQQNQTKQEPPKPKQEQRRPVNPPNASQSALPNCYHVLGLTPSSTKEEAVAKYHQMVLAYHPDRVSHMAPEFKELAHRKLQEINAAYAELKMLRHW